MRVLKTIRSYALILFCAAAMALVYQILVFQNAFAPSGIQGICTMIQYKTGVLVGYLNLLINLPLCLIAFFAVDHDFALKNLVFAVTFSVALILFRLVPGINALAYKTENGTSTILAPIAAGVADGFLYGITMRENGATGGVDVIAGIVHSKRPETNMVWVIFSLNAAVAISSYFVFGYRLEPVILCLIYGYLTGKVSDGILKGIKSRIKFEIVTPFADAIAEEIIQTLHHSATKVSARGMYSGTGTEVLLCVIEKRQTPKLRRILDKYPGTFAYLSSVGETLGNFRAGRRKKAV